jgi:hypothetical protein
MKNVNYLETSNDLYLVEFHGNTGGIIFNGGDTGVLGDLIQLHGQHGILQIRRYNAKNTKFDKLSKSLVKQLFNHDTHSFIELKKTNFI